MEVQSVARAAKGLLKIDDVLGMKEIEAMAAFQLVRFSDSGGIPYCPNCASSDVAHLVTRLRFRCKPCGREFTVTSSTMLHGRKMGMRSYLALLSLLVDKAQFKSLLQFSKDTGIGYKTAWEQINRLRVATNGADGCTVPFSLLSREAWKKREKRWGNANRFIVPTSHVCYPYLRTTNTSEASRDGAELLSFVNNLIPRRIPDDIRADICQDMIVAILTGETTRSQLDKDHRSFISKIFAQYPWKYKWISFDAPLSDEGGRTLHDIMSTEDAESAFNAARW